MNKMLLSRKRRLVGPSERLREKVEQNRLLAFEALVLGDGRAKAEGVLDELRRIQVAIDEASVSQRVADTLVACHSIAPHGTPIRIRQRNLGLSIEGFVAL